MKSSSDYSLKYKFISKEYRKSEDPKNGINTYNIGQNLEGNFVLIISYDNTNGRLEKEVWAYPTISFIADMGGSLGLFIGVSFLSVWDFFEYLFYKYKFKK